MSDDDRYDEPQMPMFGVVLSLFALAVCVAFVVAGFAYHIAELVELIP